MLRSSSVRRSWSAKRWLELHVGGDRAKFLLDGAEIGQRPPGGVVGFEKALLKLGFAQLLATSAGWVPNAVRSGGVRNPKPLP